MLTRLNSGLHDYHMHTRLCGHAKGEMAEYVERAIELGLTEIGFSDHMPMEIWGTRDPKLSMGLADMKTYYDWVMSARDDYAGQITIKFGIEADYTPGKEKELRDFFDAWPFDYVIGSVHFIGDWSFDNPDKLDSWTGKEVDEVYREYFSLVMKAARCGMFDFLAHLDLVKKFGHRPSYDLFDTYEALAKVLAAEGLATELNTAGWHKPVAEQYPHLDFLRACARRGVPLLLSSDAHDPRHVGRDFARGLGLLRQLDIRTAPVFAGRGPAGQRPFPA